MDVVISTEAPKGRKVYHRSGCIYEKRIFPRNKMIVTKAQAKAHKYHSCKYCSGLLGEIRTNAQISMWKEKNNIEIDYVKQTNTVYKRTKIGCWKIIYDEEIKSCLLYHRNTYSEELSLEQAMDGGYHYQHDVKLADNLHKLVNYIVAHDKAKLIMMDDYRKLPRSTAKQRKYYRKAENKFRRQNTRQARQRLDDLFRSIENENPEIKKLAIR